MDIATTERERADKMGEMEGKHRSINMNIPLFCVSQFCFLPYRRGRLQPETVVNAVLVGEGLELSKGFS